MMQRTCNRCRVTGDVALFKPDRGCRGGFRPVCLGCVAEEKRLYYLRTTPGRKRLHSHAVQRAYFDVVSTVEQAYILGLLMADGSVDNIPPHKYRVRLKVKLADEELVAFVRDKLSPRSPLVYSNSRTRNRLHPQVGIEIRSRQLVDALQRWGVVPRKTGKEAWPEALPPPLRHAFALGYFDGDGHLYWAQRGRTPRLRWGVVCASHSFVERMAWEIDACTGVGVYGPYRHRQNVSVISAEGAKAHCIVQWLHQSGLGLRRKTLTGFGLPPSPGI